MRAVSEDARVRTRQRSMPTYQEGASDNHPVYGHRSFCSYAHELFSFHGRETAG
jgi:hypothetical protein